MTREPIYAAVFAKLQALGGFTTITRRLRHWADVTVQEMPYVAMVQRHEDSEGSRRGLPLRWTLHGDFTLYASQPDHDLSPCIILNPLLDAVCAAFAPDNITGTITLGGLVYHCRVNGSIATDEGVLGALTVAIIPFTITALE